MANNFKVFDEALNNVATLSEWNSDSERVGGFVVGTPAHSKVVNTALRSATLVVKALLDAVTRKQDINIDFNSSDAIIKQYIEDGILEMIRDKISQIPEAPVTSVNGKVGAVEITPESLGLAKVATSGNYADLIGKPGSELPDPTGQNDKVLGVQNGQYMLIERFQIIQTSNAAGGITYEIRA